MIQLDGDEARQLGALIGGAYERPKIVGDLEMALGELAIDWVPVPDTSPAIGKPLAQCGFRAKIGVTIIATCATRSPSAARSPTTCFREATRSSLSARLAGFLSSASCLPRGRARKNPEDDLADLRRQPDEAGGAVAKRLRGLPVTSWSQLRAFRPEDDEARPSLGDQL